MTKRQLVCFSCAAAVGVPVYLTSRAYVGNNIAVIIMIGLMLPLFLLAMFERDGQPAEKLLRNYIRARWFFPGTRHYKTENLYRYLTNKEAQPIAKKGKTTGEKAPGKRQAGQGE
jgi:hypothetical protein